MSENGKLKKELNDIDELRFIFTSPTFVKEKVRREKREFYQELDGSDGRCC